MPARSLTVTGISIYQPIKDIMKITRVVPIAAGCITLGALLTGSANAQWIRTAGPPGGNVAAIAVSGQTMLASLDDDGVYRSTDGGGSWAPSGTGLTTRHVPVFAVSGAGVFAGTQDGLFSSTDDGVSWQARGLGGSALVACALLGQNIYAGTPSHGLFRSTDGGGSWQHADTGLQTSGVYNLTSILAARGKLYAGVWGKGVFVSADSGRHWTQSAAGLSSLYVTCIAAVDSTLFAGRDGGVDHSTDDGATWTPSQAGPSMYYMYAITGIGPRIFAAARNGLYLSTDRGISWRTSDTGMVCQSVLSLGVRGSTLYAGTNGGGVYSSTDGGSRWTCASGGLCGTTISALCASDSGLYAASAGGGVSISTDGGWHWAEDNAGLTAFAVTSFAFSASGMFAGATYTLLQSPHMGAPWTTVQVGVPVPLFGCVTAQGADIYAGSNDQVAHSADGGVHWTYADIIMYNPSAVTALHVRGTKVFAGTHSGEIYCSLDSGATWTHAGLNPYPVLAFASSGGILYAGTYGGGVFRTTDEGASWISVNNYLTNLYVNCLSAGGNSVLAGTSGGGVFLSPNSGTVWGAANEGMTSAAVYSLAVRNSYLYAGTYANGLFRRPLSDVMSVGTTPPVVRGLSRLEGNYPNPFNPSTVIRYFTAARSHVTLAVFTLLGQRVAMLVDGVEEAGEHSVRFDGTGLGAGAYFCRLRAGEFTAVRRLMLVR